MTIPHRQSGATYEGASTNREKRFAAAVPAGAEAFTGEGARLYGGRWNSPGVAMVYASATRSLAALETLVHINPFLPLKYVIYQVEFDDKVIESISAGKLPAGWDAEPPGPASMEIGDRCAKALRSVVLAVPSVITAETNYLLNSAHPDLKKLRGHRLER